MRSAHRHGLDLVVGDVNHRRLKPLMEPRDFGPHLDPHLGVEVRERFVEEENLRLADDRAPDCDSLPLTAGERFRLAIEQRLDPENAGGVDYPFLDFGLGKFSQLQAEGEIVVNAHVGIERVILEDHRDITVLRRHVINAFVADVDIALRDLFQTRDHAQGG